MDVTKICWEKGPSVKQNKLLEVLDCFPRALNNATVLYVDACSQQLPDLDLQPSLLPSRFLQSYYNREQIFACGHQHLLAKDYSENHDILSKSHIRISRVSRLGLERPRPSSLDSSRTRNRSRCLRVTQSQTRNRTRN